MATDHLAFRATQPHPPRCPLAARRFLSIDASAGANEVVFRAIDDEGAGAAAGAGGGDHAAKGRGEQIWLRERQRVDR